MCIKKKKNQTNNRECNQMPGNRILWRSDHPIWYLFLLSGVNNSYWRNERWQCQRKPKHKTKKPCLNLWILQKLRGRLFPKVHLRWPFQYYEWIRLPDNKEMVLAGKWKNLWHNRQTSKLLQAWGCCFVWYPDAEDWVYFIKSGKNKLLCCSTWIIITISCKRLHQFSAIMVKITAAHILDWSCKLIFPFPSWSWPFCTDFFCHTTGCLKELLHSGDWNVLAILGEAP